jgi:hypothetical protein
MVFVKRKKESIDWSVPKHLTEIRIKNVGEAGINQMNLEKRVTELVDFIMKSAGIKNYRIVWLEEFTETNEYVLRTYELPSWDEIEAIGCGKVETVEVLTCLEKKLGKKYLAINFVDIPAYVVVEIQQ